MAKKKRAAGKAPDMPLETAMEELAEIVDRLESGQQPLSESLEKFERGMQLLKHCDQQLDDATSRIEVVRRMTSEGAEVEPFDGTATANRDDGETTDPVKGNLF